MTNEYPFTSAISAAVYAPLVQLTLLPSRLEAISPFVDELMRFISHFRELDGSEVDIEIAVREALNNAVVHGNHFDLDKEIGVLCRGTLEGEVWITVRDQGQGFAEYAVADPTEPQNLLTAHGRGIYLMQALMDDVWFDDGGTVVHMHKKPNLQVSTASHLLQ